MLCAVMDQLMHVLAKQRFLCLIAKQGEATGIAEGAIALLVHAIDSLRRRVKDEPETLLARFQLLLFQGFLD
ncbi:hypothetical protein SDC9_156423 [bioreactor metagenome]|uniref:Uncharacterized protein n=1 Tax=bioreactor metagenome TaxID=1076179 RepID=A0A645F474_9ZZZZ